MPGSPVGVLYAQPPLELGSTSAPSAVRVYLKGLVSFKPLAWGGGSSDGRAHLKLEVKELIWRGSTWRFSPYSSWRNSIWTGSALMKVERRRKRLVEGFHYPGMCDVGIRLTIGFSSLRCSGPVVGDSWPKMV